MFLYSCDGKAVKLKIKLNILFAREVLVSSLYETRNVLKEEKYGMK
jgi:hypothetical protein